jgi:hypothetical protein
MANTSEPLPPIGNPQPADLGVTLNGGEQPIIGFQYVTSPNLGPPAMLVTLAATQYYEFAVAKIFEDRSGLAVTPIQGPPGTPASVTRECAPYGWMTMNWRSTRLESNPQVPSRDLGDPNLVYKGGKIIVMNSGYTADAKQIVTMEGTYEYWLRVPYTETDTISTATSPFLADEVAVTLKPTDFNTAIAGPNLPPAGAPTNPITF